MLRIRKATINDRLFTKNLDEGNMKEMVESYGRRYDASMFDSFRPENCFIAEHDGVPVGFAYFSVPGNKLDLWTIQVEELHRNKGYGAALIKMVCEYAREKKLRKIVLEVHDKNIAAKRFYERLGFTEVHSSKKGKICLKLELIPRDTNH